MAAFTTEFLQSGAVFLTAAAVAVPLAQRAGLGAVLGYLIAGVIIGPWGLGLISDVNAILHFSEFGVVMLLFLIGLELNIKKLWNMRGPIIGLGGAQVVVTSMVIACLIAFIDVSWQVSLVIGMGLALSSTAIALRVIEEQELARSETGQSGFAVLLFQDIAVIPMLALLPLLAGHSSGSWIDGVWMLCGIAGLLLGGRYLLNPVFSYIVKSRVHELFTVAALLLVIGISLMMQALGLSMALGTFLAGVLLAESEFRHELEVSIEPFKGLLLGLFFIAVGMSVDLGVLFQHPVEIMMAVIGLVCLKSGLLYVLARLFGVQSKSRSTMAVILSQGGEFAFVLFTAAQSQGLLQSDQSAFLLVVVSLSMMTTPLLLLVQRKWFARGLNTFVMDEQNVEVPNHQPRVIVAGFGRFGQIVGRLMYANKIKITVLESDASQIQLLRKYGYDVFYGDATNLELLKSAGAEDAEAIVVCTDSPDEVMRIVTICKEKFPQLKVFARARSRVEVYQLMNQGVAHYSRETFLGALDLGHQALIELGMHPYEAKRAEQLFKRLDNAMLEELQTAHSEGNKQSLRVREAREELEEIFGREMEKDRQAPEFWNND